MLDGRHAQVDGYPSGNWFGPTILSDVTEGMECYQQEIFAPVFTCSKADTLDDAIAMINRNRYGNGTALFTNSGAVARKFTHEVEAGQIGINVPIPVPLPHFSFTGNKVLLSTSTNAFKRVAPPSFSQFYWGGNVRF